MATNITSTRDAEIPIYAGSEVMSFTVAQMPPGIKIYTYVNGVNITPFTAPVTSGALLGDTITTDQLGSALGFVYIPSTEGKYKFNAGEIRLTFGDSADGIEKCKYISETTLMNHGLNIVDPEQGGTIALRTTEKFRTSPLGSSADPNNTQKRLDPLSQTFTIDAGTYPLGIVLTYINLFFYTKDDKLPVSIELRPMSGSKPSTTEYMSGTISTKAPTDINVYDATAGAKATTFVFGNPIYLKPGEYAFCVYTKSDKYQLLSAKTGDGKTVKQPFAGRLFKAQNTTDWLGDENEDLTFMLGKAKFDPGTVTFEMTTPALAEIDYNRIRLLSTEIALGDTAQVTYKIQTTEDTNSRDKTNFTDIVPGSELNLTGRQSLREKGDLKLQVSLTTKSKDVAPFLDKQLMKAQIFRNNVLPYSADISTSELAANHGTARARYISKVVSLADQFDSTGMEVKVNVNRKIGTDIEVFVRVLSRNDKSFVNGISARPFIKLPLVSPVSKSYAGTNDDLFTEETYRLLEPALTYSNSANLVSNVAITSTYETFANYQVKIVFYANNPVYLPKIKNLVATSLL